jgi:RsiW-degrading membrane proteinase PrsW (M82 family)
MFEDSTRARTPPQADADYEKDWDTFRRLNRNAVGAAVGLFGVPVLAVLVFIASSGHPPSESTQSLIVAFLGAAFVTLSIAVIYTRWRMVKWRCPRCGREFHQTSVLNRWNVYFQDSCAHCGLGIGSGPK